MKIPLLKTPSFIRKQELCNKIVEAHRQRSFDIIDTIVHSPQGVYEAMKLRHERQSRGQDVGTTSYSEMQDFATYHTKQADMYERLGNSPKLYFRSESELEDDFEGIPKNDKC